jgi:hypothetical protein
VVGPRRSCHVKARPPPGRYRTQGTSSAPAPEPSAPRHRADLHGSRSAGRDARRHLDARGTGDISPRAGGADARTDPGAVPPRPVPARPVPARPIPVASPPGPCGPWGFCGNGVPGVTGEFGTALATPPAPNPIAVKPKAPTIAAATIIFLRLIMHPRCKSQSNEPVSRFHSPLLSEQTKGATSKVRLALF